MKSLRDLSLLRYWCSTVYAGVKNFVSLSRQSQNNRFWNVIAVLFISLMLRWNLIFRGGQYYFPDEIKYDYSINIASSILKEDFSKAFADLTVTPGQIVFRAIGIIPASVENYFHRPSVVPAIFFSFFSVTNLALIWGIAKRVGIPERGAWFALLIAASSHSLIYYTRHLLPYDLSLSFGLLALYIGLDPDHKANVYLASGSLIFLCFASYSGYWPIAGFAALVPTMIKTGGGKLSFFRKFFFTAIGAIAPFLILATIMSIGAKVNIFVDYKDFAGTITQGNFVEGWSLPFEYLWHTEHLLVIILIALSLFASWNLSLENQKVIFVGSGGILFIYLCLFVPSTILHKFVVYGRLSRQLVPFLALSSAYGLLILSKKGKLGNAIAVSILAAVIVQGVLNYRYSSTITFPREFIKKVQAEYPSFKMSIKRTNTGAPFICKYRNYVAMNVKYIHPIPESLPGIEEDILFSEPHPMNFFPYQYEGYTPGERNLFRNETVKMELIQVKDDSQALVMFGKLKSCVSTVE